jgi:hypothetical protein
VFSLVWVVREKKLQKEEVVSAESLRLPQGPKGRSDSSSKAMATEPVCSDSTIRTHTFRATGPIRLVGIREFQTHSRSHREVDNNWLITPYPMSRMSGTATAGKNATAGTTVEATVEQLRQSKQKVWNRTPWPLSFRTSDNPPGRRADPCHRGVAFFLTFPHVPAGQTLGQLAGRSVSSGASPAHVSSRHTNHTETTPKQITKEYQKASLTKDKSRESELGPTTPNARGIPSCLFRLVRIRVSFLKQPNGFGFVSRNDGYGYGCNHLPELEFTRRGFGSGLFASRARRC